MSQADTRMETVKILSKETILQMIENGGFVYSVGQRFKAYKTMMGE